MDSHQLEQIFHSLKRDTEDVIETRLLVDSIKHSAIASNQQLDQIVHCFDPTNCGFITFEHFKSGIKELYERSASSASSSIAEPPVERSSPTAHTESLCELNHDSEHTLLSFNSDLDNSTLVPTNTDSFNHEKYSDDLACMTSLSPSSSTGFDNMSLLENQRNNDVNQLEEHYEFTPSPENINVFKSDDPEEDFTYSNGDNSYNSLKSANFQQRNTWVRSSIRRNGSQKLPTNDSTSHSRRSSLSYESDEMNNEINLEEDVQNMNDKLKKLQEQIEVLSEAQMKNDVKYSSMKRENVNLNNKINYLEEQIRDFEIQSEERKVEEERRSKEQMARLEREKAQELENYVNRILALQKDLFEAKEEIKRHQQTAESLHEAKSDLEGQIHDKELEVESLKSEIEKLKETIRVQAEESRANSTIIEALNQELNANSHSENIPKPAQREPQESEMNVNEELKNQLRMLKDENNLLKDSNEELRAQLLNNHLMEGKSLLKEGEAISSLASEISDLNTEQLKATLKEQQDVNAKLRSYIDGILLNIVENYPQLLEVKPH